MNWFRSESSEAMDTSKTTKKDLLAEDAIGINAAKLGCAFVCELNKMRKRRIEKEEEIEEQQCSSGFSKEEGEGEDGQPPPPPKCATPEDVQDTAANDFDDDDNDDDYEEDVNSRERHDEDANRNTRDAHPPRFFTRAQHSKPVSSLAQRVTKIRMPSIQLWMVVVRNLLRAEHHAIPRDVRQRSETSRHRHEHAIFPGYFQRLRHRSAITRALRRQRS